MKRAFLLFMIVVSCVSQELCAQKVGVKTNLAADFMLNPNIGLEVGLAPKWTLEVDGQFNAWTLSDDDSRKLKDSRYQGWFMGAGVSYGYAWILGRHWNLEAEIGAGYSYTRYDRFRCAGCGKKVETDKPHHYVGPTKVAINLVYLF